MIMYGDRFVHYAILQESIWSSPTGDVQMPNVIQRYRHTYMAQENSKFFVKNVLQTDSITSGV